MFYWGLVENIDDPIKSGQVKVRVIGIYDDLTEAELPWCQVARSPEFGTTFNIGISNHNLIKGSQVLCVFLDQYYQQPFILCQVPRSSDCNNNTSLTKRTIITKSGHTITIDDGSDPSIDITDTAQNSIHLGKTGVKISATKDILKKLDGNIELKSSALNINISGDVNITSSGEVNIKGNKINLN